MDGKPKTAAYTSPGLDWHQGVSESLGWLSTFSKIQLGFTTKKKINFSKKKKKRQIEFPVSMNNLKTKIKKSETIPDNLVINSKNACF
jgi:hypothetical protein